MKAWELIELLKQRPDAEVVTYDYMSGCTSKVVGVDAMSQKIGLAGEPSIDTEVICVIEEPWMWSLSPVNWKRFPGPLL